MIHKHHHQLGWDNSIDPVLSVSPGETILVGTVYAWGGQLHAKATLEDVNALDFEKVNPVTGPFFIEGAEPGDAVAITFNAFHVSGLGWTTNVPGFVLLAENFPDPAPHVWSYDTGLSKPASFGPFGQVALKTFVGTIGRALAEADRHSVVPPLRATERVAVPQSKARWVSRSRSI